MSKTVQNRFWPSLRVYPEIGVTLESCLWNAVKLTRLLRASVKHAWVDAQRSGQWMSPSVFHPLAQHSQRRRAEAQTIRWQQCSLIGQPPRQRCIATT